MVYAGGQCADCTLSEDSCFFMIITEKTAVRHSERLQKKDMQVPGREYSWNLFV